MKDYIKGEIYKISQHQKEKWDEKLQKWLPHNGDYAVFVGWIKLNDKNQFPVFKFDGYAKCTKIPYCYAIFQNGKEVARGASIEGMMERFHLNITYQGDGYETISVGSRKLPKTEFITEAREAGLNREQIDKCLAIGRYYGFSGYFGEIKTCPTCKVLRQTTCSACGCGSCKICGHKWTCMPPIDLSKNFSVIDPFYR